MPAHTWHLRVEAGSYEPQYIVITHPVSGAPVDLTETGFLVHGVVATRPDGQGAVLLDLPETSGVWRRTNTGRIYFEPAAAVSSLWTFRRGFHHVELRHPIGQPVRVAAGRFTVSPELVTA